MTVKFHTLKQEQWLRRPVGEVFEFFADARNLEQITPPWLNFRILDADPIAPGATIRYQLRWHGVPIRWTTEILHWDAPHQFVDLQRSGPYRLWHHTHRFESDGDQTKMTDIVRYSLPFGMLGRFIHAAKVRADVRLIFQYRRDRIQELFG
jgi:ligand-binding SRPBCC domain-containing protein